MDKKTENVKNEIVIQHNDLLLASKPDFTADMLNIFQAICIMAKERGTEDVVITYDLLKDLAFLPKKIHKERLIEYIEKIEEKMVGMATRLHGENGETKTFVLFAFNNKPQEEILIVNVHKWYRYMLNDFTNHYTFFELREYAELKSVYAKGIYTMLRRFRTSGIWTVRTEELRRFLSIPESYEANDIKRKIIEPAVEELKRYYPTLRYETLRSKNTNEDGKPRRGRPPITAYRFFFEHEELKSNSTSSLTQDRIAEINGWERTGRFCPVCHREVYSKMQTNDYGNFYIIGHTDFKTGGCDWHTNDFSEALSKEQLQDLEVTSATTKHSENLMKLDEITKNMFNY